MSTYIFKKSLVQHVIQTHVMKGETESAEKRESEWSVLAQSITVPGKQIYFVFYCLNNYLFSCGPLQPPVS